MAEPLKAFFSPALVRRLAADLERVSPAFPATAFVRRATAGLDELELLERGKHLARALAEYLPPSYPEALELLLRSLGPEHASDELIGAGMAPLLLSATHATVDYRVYFMKANGKQLPKVFKLRRIDLAAFGSIELTGKVSFAEKTTRRHYAGEHRIDVLVNGVAFTLGNFTVLS